MKRLEEYRQKKMMKKMEELKKKKPPFKVGTYKLERGKASIYTAVRNTAVPYLNRFTLFRKISLVCHRLSQIFFQAVK